MDTRWLLPVVVVLAALSLVPACNRTVAPNPTRSERLAPDRATKIVGSWKLVQTINGGKTDPAEVDSRYTFRPDGTGVLLFDGTSESFKWKVDDTGVYRQAVGSPEGGWEYLFFRDGRMYLSDMIDSWGVYARSQEGSAPR